MMPRCSVFVAAHAVKPNKRIPNCDGGEDIISVHTFVMEGFMSLSKVFVSRRRAGNKNNVSNVMSLLYWSAYDASAPCSILEHMSKPS